jgi:hypothetical protein
VEEKSAGPPKGVKVETSPDGLWISWPPLGHDWLIAVPFLVLFALLFITPSNREDFSSILLFVLIFAGGAYVVGVGLFNRSVIEIARHALIARCGPLPYKSRREFDSRLVRQVYVKLERVGRLTGYGIYILSQDGRHERFWRVIDGRLALYLEQEIEQILGIPDEVVRGEWRPDPYLWEA